MENNSKTAVRKQSFIEKLVAQLKGGDEAKLSRFSGKLEKYFSKQIKMREEKIESLEDSILDAKEVLEETVLAVDLDAINKGEGAEDYCPSYVKKVQSKLEAISTLEDQKESLQDEIKGLKEVQEAIFG